MLCKAADRMQKPSWCGTLAIFLIVLLVAKPASAQAANLEVRWTDEVGNVLTIAQVQDRVALRTSTGLIFDGSLSGRALELARYRLLLDVDCEVPDDFRMLRIEGQLSDENEIQATYTSPRFQCFEDGTFEPRDPLAVEKTFKRDIPSIALFLAPNGQEPRAVDHALYAVPLILEIRYDGAGPQGDRQTVELLAEESRLQIEVSRVAEQEGSVFRSQRFQLWPDDGGLGPPMTPVVEPD